MRKLLSLFDYVYYRIFYFSKEKGDNAPETNGTLILSLLQCFTILDVMIGVQLFHDYRFPNKFLILLVAAIIAVTNWYRYEKNTLLTNLDSRFKTEDGRKRARNGWLLAIFMLIVLLAPAVYGYLKVNLKAFE